MNVLHVHSGNIFGGVERMLETLAPATAGVAPVRSSFALCFEGPVSELLRHAGAEMHHLGPIRMRRLDEIRRGRRALRQVLGSQPWDAAFVHSAWSQALFGAPVLASGIPLVRWLHAPQPGPRLLEYWSSRARPVLVLCNSRYTCEAVGRRLGDVPRVVQYPPATAHVPAPHDRPAIRASLGTPPDAVVLVLAARLEPGKGHGLFIDALAKLSSSRWEAWIVGGVQQDAERPYRHALGERASRAGISERIRFLGQRNDVPALLSAADVYCQPNQAPDSFGLSFVEALAAGLPVVTTRMGAAPEIVDGSCGVLVEPASVPELTAALRTLVEHDDVRQTLSVGAQVRAREFCDLSRSLSRLAHELGRVAAPSRATV